MRQAHNQDQGESQQMPESMMSKNGEFVTDIGNETRYQDLEQRINELEAEKVSLESQLSQAAQRIDQSSGEISERDGHIA